MKTRGRTIAGRILALCFVALGFKIAVSAQEPEPSWSFVPQSLPLEVEFVNLIKKNHFEQGLLFWRSTFESSDFAKTPNGRVTYLYLLFRSGFEIFALESLLQSKNPEKIHPELLTLWRTLLTGNSTTPPHKALKISQTRLSPFWKKTLGEIALSDSRWNEIEVSPPRSLKAARENFRKSLTSKAEARRWGLFQSAQWLGFYGDTNSALKSLDVLKTQNSTLPVSEGAIAPERVPLTRARLLYQKGDLPGALSEYERVPKSSDYWFEAAEEMAWIHVRLDRQDRSLGIAKTLLSPAFASLVSSDVYYLNGLSQLMVCDYPKVFENSKDFKKRYSPRLTAIEKLATGKNDSVALKALSAIDKSGLHINALAKLLPELPKSLVLDDTFARHALLYRQMSQEARKWQTLHLTDSAVDKFYTSRIEEVAHKALVRIRTLAKTEVKEISQNAQKLHLVEAEVIQRLHLDDNLKGQRDGQKEDIAKSSPNTLEFPATSEEWLDEIDSYKVQVKDCPKLERAAL